MIGRFDLAVPAAADDLVRMVESHRQTTRQPYAAILMFGLAGTPDCSEEVRVYAGYRHLAENPDDGPAWLELARLHAGAGDYERAFAILDELDRHGAPDLYPEIYSEDLDAHRAHFLADAGRLTEALDLLDELSARHGESAVYRYARASALHALGRFDQAVAGYDEALEALAEAETEDDGETDFESVGEFLARCRAAAEKSEPFGGPRPWMLSEVRDEE